MRGRSENLHALRMCLWHGVFPGLIILRAIDRAECSLTGDTAFQLSFNFSGAALFQRICATACQHRPGNREEDRQALHLLILGSERLIAIAD